MGGRYSCSSKTVCLATISKLGKYSSSHESCSGISTASGLTSILSFSRLIALFELASMPMFECSQIVACIPRSQEVTDSEIVRNLGWCGFNLTTLKPWISEQCVEHCLSTKWLFLCAEV
jgi:hypothetical protein